MPETLNEKALLPCPFCGDLCQIIRGEVWVTDITFALDNLRVHQRQLDMDGIEVGVSRQALNEVIRHCGEQIGRIVLLETENERLRIALADLLSWFPDRPSPAEWRLLAGEYGADDAVTYARRALEGGE